MAKTKRVKGWTAPDVRSADDPVETVVPDAGVNRKTRRAAGARPPGWLGKRLGQNRRIRRDQHR
jgi:hypothetical protein